LFDESLKNFVMMPQRCAAFHDERVRGLAP
jgi:hypothetical protein